MTPRAYLQQIPTAILRRLVDAADAGAVGLIPCPWTPSGGTNVDQRRHWSKRYAAHGELHEPALCALGFAAAIHKENLAITAGPVYLLWEVCCRPDAVRLDPDNLTSALKPLLDLYVRGGVLPDDSPRYVGANITTYAKHDGAPWTLLLIFSSWEELAAYKGTQP